MSVIVRVDLACLLGVVLSVNLMTMGCMGVVARRLVVSGFMAFRRGAVVFGGLLVMIRSFVMMLGSLF